MSDLTPAKHEDVLFAVWFALNFRDNRKAAKKAEDPRIAAARVVEYLRSRNFVAMQGPPAEAPRYRG